MNERRKLRVRAGETAQQLRTAAALAEDFGSVPSPYFVAHDHM